MLLVKINHSKSIVTVTVASRGKEGGMDIRSSMPSCSTDLGFLTHSDQDDVVGANPRENNRS